jgi:hypothetical protein
VASFLRENLPAAYCVATGELFSFHSETVSSQCDVIVYDDQRTPIFGRGAAVQQVPIEGTYVVIEVRSIIDTAALRDTARKFKVIRDLWKESCDMGNGNKLEDGPSFMLWLQENGVRKSLFEVCGGSARRGLLDCLPGFWMLSPGWA